MNLKNLIVRQEKTLSIDEGIRTLEDLDPSPDIELISAVLIPRVHLKSTHLRGATLDQAVDFLKKIKEKHGILFGRYTASEDSASKLWNHYLTFPCSTSCGSAIEHSVDYNSPLVEPVFINSSEQ